MQDLADFENISLRYESTVERRGAREMADPLGRDFLPLPQI
jgi:hypothetical protein